jgi:hypothetical protein
MFTNPNSFSGVVQDLSKLRILQRGCHQNAFNMIASRRTITVLTGGSSFLQG